MISKIKRAYKAAPIATVVLAISVVVALGFTVRVIADVIDGPREQKEVVIEAWMTPKYISRTWHIPPAELGDLLNIEKRGGRPDNLEKLAADRGMDVEDLIAQLEQDILAFQQERQEQRERK